MSSAGPAVTQHDLPSGSISAALKGYILQGSEFLRDGDAVVSIEMYASVAGSFRFLVVANKLLIFVKYNNFLYILALILYLNCIILSYTFILVLCLYCFPVFRDSHFGSQI